MAKTQKAKTTEKKTNRTGKERNAHGQFMKGNTIGEETRFKLNHILSTKYDDNFHPFAVLEYFESLAEDGEVPLLEGFAADSNLSYNCVLGWANDVEGHPHFVSAYKNCMAIQKKMLVKLGLNGVHNANLTKFMLENNHGMRERTRTENDVTFTVRMPSEVDEEAN